MSYLDQFFNIKVLPKPRPRFTRTGRTYNPSNVCINEMDIASAVARAFAPQPQISEPVSVVLVIYLLPPKKPKFEHHGVRPDLDNLVKTVFDALNRSGIWADDCLCCELQASKMYGQQSGFHLKITPVIATFNKNTIH